MKKILIIEDDSVIAHIYLRQFRAEGFQIELAPSGEIGIEMVRHSRPDLVVLDLQLPKMSGIEVLKFIRAQASTATVPVIVFSNSYLGNIVDAAWKAGANKCLTKTICTPRQLMDTVRQTLASPAVPAPPPKPAAKAAPAPAVAEPPASVPTAADKVFQSEIRRNFLKEAPQHLAALRNLLQAFVLNESDKVSTRWLADRTKILFELCQISHTFNRQAGVAGVGRIARMSTAVEALLKALHLKPANVNPSTLRTVSHAVDFLETLVEHSDRSDSEAPSAVLAVDDEPISRRAVVVGLENAGLQATSLGDPFAALAKLAATRYDLILLDVDMPRLNGYELCVKLRSLPLHKQTPVIFVTTLSDFESCARSSISGGNDLIAKPILPIELSVKALMYLIKGQLNAMTKAV